MTITVTASGISLDGPLVAGEVVAVSVSGVTFVEDSKPTLCLLGRFPDALLSSVELTEDENTPGTWTGQLDTATKQTAVFFATARADECRDAVLELVAARKSVARLMVAFRNSALCPSPFHAPDASPVYVPVPGPPGQGGDPYDQNPAMDGTASAGASDEYARGDHVHPTDTSRASAADVTAIQSLIPSNASSSNKLATVEDMPSGQVNADWTATSGPAEILHKPNLAAVATSGDYADLTNKPTIPGPAPVSSVNGETGDVEIYGSTLLMSTVDSTIVSEAVGDAQEDATRALSEISYKASSAALAPAFSTSSTYAVGDYVTHEGLLYKCTTAVSTAGAWDATKWTAVAVTDEMGQSTPLPYDAEVEYILATDGQYIDTGIAANTITAAEGIVSTSSGTKSMFGARDGAGSNMLYVGYYTTNVNGFRLSYGSSTDGRKVSSSQLSGFIPVGFNQSGLWYGDSSTSISLSGTVTTKNAYLFTFNNNGAPLTGETTYMAVRSFQIFGANGALVRDYIAVRKNGVGCLYDRVSGTFFYNAGTGSFAFGSDVANTNANLLPIASTTTLAPETAVYRSALNADGTFPTITDSGIQTTAAYYQFELELTVPSTVPSTITGPTGWTWMDGGSLPDPSDLSGGETLYIACRLDCTARTIKANCYEVA